MGNDIITYNVSEGNDEVLIAGGGDNDAATVHATAPDFTVLDDGGATLYQLATDGNMIRLKCIEHVTLRGANDLVLFDDDLSPPSYTLTVVKTGTGTDTVLSTPSGIGCGGYCGETHGCAEKITLTATPDAGSTVSGWWGWGCYGTQDCVVTMDASKTVKAHFWPCPACSGDVDITENIIFGPDMTYECAGRVTIAAGGSVTIEARSTVTFSDP